MTNLLKFESKSFNSIKEFSDEYGFSKKLVATMSMNDISLDDIFLKLSKKEEKPKTLRLEVLDRDYEKVSDFYNEFGISKATVTFRMKQGLSLDSIFLLYVKDVPFKVGMVHFKDRDEFCKTIGLTFSDIKPLLSLRLGVEEIYEKAITSSKSIDRTGKELAKIAHTNESNVQRFRREGMSDEEIINYCKKGLSTKKPLVVYNIEYESRKKFADELGITGNDIWVYCNKGYTHEQIYDLFKNKKSNVD